MKPPEPYLRNMPGAYWNKAVSLARLESSCQIACFMSELDSADCNVGVQCQDVACFPIRSLGLASWNWLAFDWSAPDIVARPRVGIILGTEHPDSWVRTNHSMLPPVKLNGRGVSSSHLRASCRETEGSCTQEGLWVLFQVLYLLRGSAVEPVKASNED